MSTHITNATYAKGKVTTSAGDYGYSRRLIGPDSICCGNRGFTSLGGREACPDSLRNENHGCGQACRRVEIEDNVWRPQIAQFPLDAAPAFGNGGVAVSHSVMDINQGVDYQMPSNVYANSGHGSNAQYSVLGGAPAPTRAPAGNANAVTGGQ